MFYPQILLEVVTPASEPDLDWLGPFATLVGGVLVALIGGISAVWRRKQDKKDKRDEANEAAQPRVVDGWEEIREARTETTTYYKLMTIYRDMHHQTQAALRSLVRSIRKAHPDQEFEQDVIDALELRAPEPTER
jgi:hypothetical protein